MSLSYRKDIEIIYALLSKITRIEQSLLLIFYLEMTLNNL